MNSKEIINNINKGKEVLAYDQFQKLIEARKIEDIAKVIWYFNLKLSEVEYTMHVKGGMDTILLKDILLKVADVLLENCQNRL